MFSTRHLLEGYKNNTPLNENEWNFLFVYSKDLLSVNANVSILILANMTLSTMANDKYGKTLT